MENKKDYTAFISDNEAKIFTGKKLDLSTFKPSQRTLLNKLAVEAVKQYQRNKAKSKHPERMGLPSLSTNTCYDIFYEHLPRGWTQGKQTPYANKYVVPHSKMKTDPFVRKAMKHSNETIRNIYHQCQSKTKQTSNFAVMKTLCRYGENHTPRPKSKLWDKALQITREAFFQNRRFKLMCMNLTCESFDPNSSAGNSFPGKKKGEVYKEAYKLARYMHHNIKHKSRSGIFRPYTKIAYRGHLSDETWNDQKTRPIFVSPFEVQLLESMVAHNLYQHLLLRSGPMFFGAGTLARLRDEVGHSAPTETKYTADISHFDTDITPWMMYDALFKVIRPSLDDTMIDVDGSVHRMKAETVDRLLMWIYQYNVHTPILLPNGKVVEKHGGLLSGSYLTQLLGSIINYATGTFVDLSLGLKPKKFFVLGDDSRREYGIPKHLFPSQKYSDIYLCTFGFTVHPDKCIVVSADNINDDKFLGYKFVGNKLFRETQKWFEMALFPEGDIEQLSISAARMLAFLTIGGINDPLFVTFSKTYFAGYHITKTGELDRAYKSKMKYSTSIHFQEFVNLKNVEWSNLFFMMF